MKIDIEKLKKIEEACGSFDIGRIIGGGNYNYLRFGYWKPTDWETLQNILAPTIVVEEDSDYDDDCGWKYSYVLYDREEWLNIQNYRREHSFSNRTSTTNIQK
jgi:hypothetical protein